MLQICRGANPPVAAGIAPAKSGRPERAGCRLKGKARLVWPATAVQAAGCVAGSSAFAADLQRAQRAMAAPGTAASA